MAPDALTERRILVGVTGGIAAYKAAELVRLFVKAGAEVRVVMTEAATKFITPLTLQALSQHPVATDLFAAEEEGAAPGGTSSPSAPGESRIGHIELADWAELFVIAPATADALARVAAGMANDLVTTIALACRAPLLVAPAMNVNMWEKAATRDNLARLVERGVTTVGPDTGGLACGWVGAGRMAEPPEIFAACVRALGPRDLRGVSVLVAAGPTFEPIDPVRFVGNRSSGKMGFAVAGAAAERGARVVLVAGPTALATPPGVDRIDVKTALEMQAAVHERAAASQVIVMAAAVADYRPRAPAAEKLKKEALGDHPTIELERNPDILAELRGRVGARTLLVGFAAETEDLEERARKKRKDKDCDLLVANDVSEAGSGFETDTNRVLLVSRDGAAEWLPRLGKREVAHRILDRVRPLLGASAEKRA